MKVRPGPLGTLAVSELVGTVLLLGITVVLFSVLSVAVLGQLSGTEPPRNVDFRVYDLDDHRRVTMTAVWGQSLEISETELIYEVDYVRRSTRLTEVPLASNLRHRDLGSPEAWDLGESLRLACPVVEICAHPDKRVTNISVIQSDANTVIFSSEPGVVRGAIVNPVPDLQITITSIQDPMRPLGEPYYYNGGTFVISTIITNVGLLSTPTGSDIRVQYYLDGSPTPFHTFVRTSFLAPADSFSPSPHTPLALASGTHTVRVRVEGIPSFLEARLDNNERIRSFEVEVNRFDPGGPYEDGNDDVRFNPYGTGDSLIVPVAQVLDGAHTAMPGKGLVIPPSTGAITVSVSMNYAADRKLTIGVNLETTGGSITLTAGTTADSDLNLTGAVDVKSSDTLTINAGGKIDVSGDRLDTNNENILVSTTGGPLLGVGTSFYVPTRGPIPDQVTVRATGGLVDLQGAVFNADGNIRITSNGNLYVKNARIESDARIFFSVTSGTNTVFHEGIVVIENQNDCADVNPDAANIDPPPNPDGRSGPVNRNC